MLRRASYPSTKSNQRAVPAALPKCFTGIRVTVAVQPAPCRPVTGARPAARPPPQAARPPPQAAPRLASLLRARPGGRGARPATALPGGITPDASDRGAKWGGQEGGGADEGPAAAPCATGRRRPGGCRRRGGVRAGCEPRGGAGGKEKGRSGISCADPRTPLTSEGSGAP